MLPTDAEEALTAVGVECLRMPLSAKVDSTSSGPPDACAARHRHAARRGGAELAGSFLAGRLADELHAFIAPLLLGPRGRPGAVTGPVRTRLSRPLASPRPRGSSSARTPTFTARSSIPTEESRPLARHAPRSRAQTTRPDHAPRSRAKTLLPEMSERGGRPHGQNAAGNAAQRPSFACSSF